MQPPWVLIKFECVTKPLHLLLPAPVTRRPGRGSPPRIPSSPGRVDADDGPCGQGRCEAGCHLVDRGDRFTKCIISISLIVTINVITVHHPHLHSLTHTRRSYYKATGTHGRGAEDILSVGLSRIQLILSLWVEIIWGQGRRPGRKAKRRVATAVFRQHHHEKMVLHCFVLF